MAWEALECRRHCAGEVVPARLPQTDWIFGPIVGGVIFGFLPEFLRAWAIQPEVQWIVYGVLMVLVVYFLPQGIVPALKNAAGKKP